MRGQPQRIPPVRDISGDRVLASMRPADRGFARHGQPVRVAIADNIYAKECLMLPNVLSRPTTRVLAGAGLVVLAIAAALAITASPPAVAASGSCAGSLIESRNLNVGGKKAGELDVYYNGATGKNCARMNHAGSTWGKKLTTRVWIGICSETTPGNKTCHYNASTDAADRGSYSYYAGPATTQVSARGKCIAASGYLWINGKRYAASTNPWVGHCG
jgi:hypothetical protein